MSVYGVYVWDPSNMYHKTFPRKTYRRRVSAEKWADKNTKYVDGRYYPDGGFVVRTMQPDWVGYPED